MHSVVVQLINTPQHAYFAALGVEQLQYYWDESARSPRFPWIVGAPPAKVSQIYDSLQRSMMRYADVYA